MAEVNVKITVVERWWVNPVNEALIIFCALVSCVSWKAAHKAQDIGLDLLCRFGYKFEAQ